MELVISIVSWNTRELLGRCLSSLARFTDPRRVRVIVIDNASADGTPTMVRDEFPTVQLIETGANLGFGRAHNLLANRTREPFVLFLNPDTELMEDAPGKMLDCFARQPRVGMMSCLTMDETSAIRPLGYQLPTTPWSELLNGVFASRFSMPLARRILPYHDPATSGFVRKLYGGCLMARREALVAAGWFDERFFMYGEDVDLSRRIESAGWQLFYLSSARVMHRGGGASEKAPAGFATLMQCESIARLMSKYYGVAGRAAYRFAIMTRALARLAAGAAIARESRRKHLVMLRWSLGLASPVIPR